MSDYILNFYYFYYFEMDKINLYFLCEIEMEVHSYLVYGFTSTSFLSQAPLYTAL